MTVNLPPMPGFGTAPTITTLRFELGSQIGRGQGAEVFLARDLQLDTQVAMKRMRKQSFPRSMEFFDEARRLYDSRHRHIVELKYACDDADYIYLAMPYYRGGSLQRRIEQSYLSVRDIVRHGISFLCGLYHVHVRGLLHFDVKPSNVLLDDSDTALLADFGLSRQVDTQGRVVILSAYKQHIPPEWLVSGRVAKTADIYQAGLTLYRMCSGPEELERQAVWHNIDTNTKAIANGSFPDRKRFLPHVPTRLRKAICRALDCDPANRYASVPDLMNDLASVVESVDWMYSEGAEWGIGTWQESGGRSSRRVSLTRHGQTWDVHSCRVTEAGQERRHLNYCSAGLDEVAARRLVKEALRKPWTNTYSS